VPERTDAKHLNSRLEQRHEGVAVRCGAMRLACALSGHLESESSSIPFEVNFKTLAPPLDLLPTFAKNFCHVGHVARFGHQKFK